MTLVPFRVRGVAPRGRPLRHLPANILEVSYLDLHCAFGVLSLEGHHRCEHEYQGLT